MSELTLLRKAVVAALFSTNPSTQVGALLSDHGGIVSTGYNFLVTPSDRHMAHAERACIYNAAKHGIRTDGLIMYATWACCEDCARAIVLSGISKVVTIGKLNRLTPARWLEQVDAGLIILRDAGIPVIYNTETLDMVIRFDGENIQL